MEQAVIEKNRTCSSCYLENDHKCYWFVKRSNEKDAKDIPADVFSSGCSKHELDIDDIRESELLLRLIEVFDGEIIGNKFKPVEKKTYYSKRRKKRVYKTKHNYTERKDW
jgi:hypothetical protein